MDAALIVVAKKPEPGFTKTRLCPPFTPQDAAKFYRCLMLDTLTLASRLKNVDRTLAYTPPDAHFYFQSLIPDGFRLMPQFGADLGERLANALAHHFESGYRRVVIMTGGGAALENDGEPIEKTLTSKVQGSR